MACALRRYGVTDSGVPKDSCATYPPTARWLIRSLQRAGHIEVRYFIFNPGCRMAICIDTKTSPFKVIT